MCACAVATPERGTQLYRKLLACNRASVCPAHLTPGVHVVDGQRVRYCTNHHVLHPESDFESKNAAKPSRRTNPTTCARARKLRTSESNNKRPRDGGEAPATRAEAGAAGCARQTGKWIGGSSAGLFASAVSAGQRVPLLLPVDWEADVDDALLGLPWGDDELSGATVHDAHMASAVLPKPPTPAPRSSLLLEQPGAMSVNTTPRTATHGLSSSTGLLGCLRLGQELQEAAPSLVANLKFTLGPLLQSHARGLRGQATVPLAERSVIARQLFAHALPATRSNGRVLEQWLSVASSLLSRSMAADAMSAEDVVLTWRIASKFSALFSQFARDYDSLLANPVGTPESQVWNMEVQSACRCTALYFQAITRAIVSSAHSSDVENCVAKACVEHIACFLTAQLASNNERIAFVERLCVPALPEAECEQDAALQLQQLTLSYSARYDTMPPAAIS